MNSYDTCVSNQLVNILQQSILFHVDDCKLRQKYPKVNESSIELLHEEYQSIFEDASSTMQVKHGKFHKYLGMTLDYYTVVQVKINMLEYIDEILDAFDKSDPIGGGTKSSAEPDMIFKVYKDCKTLMKKDLWSFITWLLKYYLLPSGPGRTPAPQFHSLP